MHKVANRLRSKGCSSPDVFYALATNCDTVSSFVGYGKKTAWSIWNTLPQLIDALLKLSCELSKIPNDVMLIIEIFYLVI